MLLMPDLLRDRSLLHENEHYVVLHGLFPQDVKMVVHGISFDTGYSVFNKSTLQMEYATLQLPDAIGTAQQLHLLLKSKPWTTAEEGFSALFGPATVNPDGSPVH